jgi:hypothetical protein
MQSPKSREHSIPTARERGVPRWRGFRCDSQRPSLVGSNPAVNANIDQPFERTREEEEEIREIKGTLPSNTANSVATGR